MPLNNEIKTFYPTSKAAWRAWLNDNHETEASVWVIFCKKDSGMPSLLWSDAVDEALCYGWIDSVKKTLDAERFIQFFCPRKPTSMWSKINKDKVEKLTTANLMTPAGLACITLAKLNGTWSILDDVEALIIPPDLDVALSANPGAKAFFISQTKTAKKMMLSWLVMAKQDSTRQKRIAEIAEHAAENRKPKQF